MDLEEHRTYLTRYGLRNYLFRMLYRIMGRTLGFKALRIVILTKDTVDAAYMEDHAVLEGSVVRGSDLQLLIGEREELSAKFVSDAIARGDRCYLFRGISDIASYGWYTKETCPVTDDVAIHFSPSYIYMLKGFTAPAYRGQRLHAFGMAHALRDAVNKGYEGLVSYIEPDNAPSLKSSLRLGYKISGTCFLFQILGQAFTFRTPGSRRHGVYLERVLPRCRGHPKKRSIMAREVCDENKKKIYEGVQAGGCTLG